VTRATAATDTCAAAATAAAAVEATAAAATVGTAAATATAVGSTAAATAAFSRVGRGRERGRKNNDGNPKLECRHDLPSPLRAFAARMCSSI
jgi:hypothetical protein